METITLPVNPKDIPAFKETAREMDIDVVVHPGENGNMNATIMIPDWECLYHFSVVFGINKYHKSVASPLNELIRSMQNKFDIYFKYHPEQKPEDYDKSKLG